MWIGRNVEAPCAGCAIYSGAVEGKRFFYHLACYEWPLVMVSETNSLYGGASGLGHL